MAARRTAERTQNFTESVIREMTRVTREYDAINLAQGFPDFPAPDLLKEAACEAIRADRNQYAITWGSTRLRKAIVAKYRTWYGMEVEGDREITVTCGATEAMAAIMLALIDPGDEVIILQPFYENFGPDAILCGARPVFLPLEAPHYELDPDRLASVVTNRTRAIVVNTPNNPTGRVFDRAELEAIAALCLEHDLIAITDEIYEHIIYDGVRHVPMAAIEGMFDRTITLNSMSKTYSVTGWRVGWAIAPPGLTGAIRKVHDFLTVGAAAPLQEAGAVALSFPETFYAELAAGYQRRRDMLLELLEPLGFVCFAPRGAYYVMTDIGGFGFADDVEFSRYLVQEVGVAAVPGSSFYHDPALGRTKVRFTFCKRDETLLEAGRRLQALAARVTTG